MNLNHEKSNPFKSDKNEKYITTDGESSTHASTPNGVGRDRRNANEEKNQRITENAEENQLKEETPERVKFDITDNDSILSFNPEIPDGGYGWVVVISAFLVFACADGLAFSFGLLHEEFTVYFQTTQSKTSLIGSLFIATPLIAGPVMSALVDRYGCRIMTMVAGVLSCAGFLLASLSNSVEILCLTFGFITGLAMGILYVTAVVSVAFWFEKRRNLAVSLASCGIGFGTLIYSPMTHYLLTIYDWRNTIIILAGTLLNMCVCGALMRDPDWLIIKHRKERLRAQTRSPTVSICSKSYAGESLYLSRDELKDLLRSGKSPDDILATLTTSIEEAEALETTTEMNSPVYKKMHSAVHLPTFVQHIEEVPPEVIEKLATNKRLYNIILKNYPDILTIRPKSEEHIAIENPLQAKPTELSVKLKLKKTKENEHEVKKDKVQKPVQKKDWFSRQLSTDRSYFKDMPLCRNKIMHRGAMMNFPKYELRAASLPNIYKNSTWSVGSSIEDEKSWYTRTVEVLTTMFDYRMITEYHFLLYSASSLIWSVWYIVPYFFLQTFMIQQEQDGGPTMISIIGIASSIGIVVLGWAGDQSWVNIPKTHCVCLIICGCTMTMYPIFIKEFWPLTIISVVFGLSFASSYSYTPAMLMELMPIEHFTVAYGLILLSEGIGHLIGPPLAGLLFDLTQSWHLTFYCAGFWVVISGLLVGVIAYTRDTRLCGKGPLLKETEDTHSTSGNEMTAL